MFTVKRYFCPAMGVQFTIPNRPATAPRGMLSICRHPAFPALISLWLAALLGLCVWVVPAGRLQALLPGLFAGQSHTLLAVLAATAGATLGLGIAIALRRLHRNARHSRPKSTPTGSGTGMAHAAASILQVEDLQLPQGFDRVELLLGGHGAPMLADHHGAAVARLRDRAMADLSLIQLVERFAVALDDYRMEGRITRHSGNGDTGTHNIPLTLPDSLQKLRQMAQAD